MHPVFTGILHPDDARRKASARSPGSHLPHRRKHDEAGRGESSLGLINRVISVKKISRIIGRSSGGS